MENLKEKIRTLSLIADNSSEIIYIINNEGGIIYENEQAKKIINSKKNIEFKNNFFKLIHEEDQIYLKKELSSISSKADICKIVDFKIRKYKNGYVNLKANAKLFDKIENNELILINARFYGDSSELFYSTDSKDKFCLLNKMSADIIDFKELTEIYKYISNSLSKILPDTVIIYVSVDEHKQETKVEQIKGASENILVKIIKTLGYNPVGKKYPLVKTHDNFFRTGKLIKFDKGLTEFSSAQVPDFVAKIIEKLLGIKNIYTIGILKEEKLLSAIHFFTTKKVKIEDNIFIETYIRQAGILIQKKLDEIKIKQTEEKASAILHSLPDMMFIQDADGVYLDYFVPKHITSHVPPKVFKGQQIQNIMPAELVDIFLPTFKKALETKQMQFKDYSLELPDGIHHYEARMIYYEENKILSIVRDITFRVSAEKIIKQQNIKLEKLIADKDRFMAILAHDLKSPFNSLLGFTNLLINNIRKYDIEKIEKQLIAINNTLNNTHNLLDDLLIWSKSQSGQITIVKKLVNLNNICADAVSNIENIAHTKKIQVIFENKTQVTTMADPNMLKAILRNLISNAIKFSYPDSKITVKLSKTGNDAIFTVSDNGVGIKPESLAKLWTEQIPYTTAGTDNEKGTGLGLMLCKEFVEKHGGKIHVESKENIGSDFHFNIPLEKE